MHICSVALFYYSRIMLCKWTCITKSGNDFFRKYLALKCFPKQFVLLSIKKLLTSCHIMMIPLLCLLENFIFSLSHIQSSNLYFPLVCLHSWYLGFTCALSLANVSCSCVPKKNYFPFFLKRYSTFIFGQQMAVWSTPLNLSSSLAEMIDFGPFFYTLKSKLFSPKIYTK